MARAGKGFIMDQLDKMIAWEQGSLDEEDTCALFQNLMDSGLIYSLQGIYQRTAQSLIDAGLIRA